MAATQFFWEFWDELISARLISQEGERLDYNVSEDEIDKEVKLLIDDYFSGDEEEFNAYLESYKASLTKLRDEIRVNILANKRAGTGTD